MLFNSVEFLFFLPCVFLVYWLCHRSIAAQNVFLLVASYIFYGWWDWRFLSLILISSLVDFFVGKGLSVCHEHRRRWALLVLSLVVNLGILGFFKYFNFFVSSFESALRSVGISTSLPTLQLILPVGISFYTFQTLSYTIDVYRKKIQATDDLLGFLAFVSFFPQLVAGPIERASHLLPQFHVSRRFSPHQASVGLRQILWGFFKKIVVADNCAIYVDYVFDEHQTLGPILLLLGLFLFACQIYCDFSGYSEIAIGVARLFGFSLVTNFQTPYFSRDIAEFWRRWHISLTTWFRDYVYIPLGGSRGGHWMSFRNVVVVFVISGLWHGANWTFVVWGLVNAFLFLPLFLSGRNRLHMDTVASGRLFPSFPEFSQMFTTFLLTLLAWVFFRSQSLAEAETYLQCLFDLSGSLIDAAQLSAFPDKKNLVLLLFIIVLTFIFEWIQREKAHLMELSWPLWMRWCFYCLVLNMIAFCGVFSRVEFIYFQF